MNLSERWIRVLSILMSFFNHKKTMDDSNESYPYAVLHDFIFSFEVGIL